jgi:hypothetical protein
MSLVCHLAVEFFWEVIGMTRNQTTKTGTQPEIRSPKDDTDSETGGVIGTFGRLYAAVAGFALRGVENIADRRAAARATRVKSKTRSA